VVHQAYKPLERPHGDWGEVHGEVLTFGFPPTAIGGYGPAGRVQTRPAKPLWAGANCGAVEWGYWTWAYVMPEVRGGKLILEGFGGKLHSYADLNQPKLSYLGVFDVFFPYTNVRSLCDVAGSTLG